EKLAQKLRADKLSLESILCSYLGGGGGRRGEVGVRAQPRGSGWSGGCHPSLFCLEKLWDSAAQALKVHQEVNCLTDVLGECIEEGKEETARPSLRGPTSLKATYDCVGHDSTCGLVQFLEKPVAKGGVIVKGLKARVAIPFVKTNIPQTLLSSLQQAGRGRGWAQDEEAAESPDSGLRVRFNPLNLKKTPGGSSGGEGALLAGGSSILGMGTNTGGSVCTPASFSVTTAAGPVARDVKSLVLCLRALLIEDVHPLHPTVPPLPFREEGDIVDPNMKDMVSQLCLPDPLKCFLAWILKYTAGVALWFLKSVSLSLPTSGSPGLARIWKRFVEWGISARVHSQVDVPGPGHVAGTSSGDPAYYIGYPAVASSRSSYLALYNILNFPAGVVPVTTVMLQDEEELAFYRGYYRDRSEKDFQEVVRGSVGLSAAVQGTALPREEELCLQFMKEVEALVKKHRES
ncbi:hypothetical protein EI555_000638, partial [Monodon monoceros]